MAKNPLELARTIAVKPQGVQGPKQNVHVRDWVRQNYPTEFQTDAIKYPFTFEELKKAWDDDPDNDFYKIASQDGQGFDSEVREEIFNGLVENLGGDYDDYYYKWLGRERPAPKEPYKSKLLAKYPDKYNSLKAQSPSLDDETYDVIAKALGIDLD